MKGKKVLILGVANERSIAWGIAKALHEAGAELAFTYLNQSMEKRVRPLAESLSASMILPCDVQKESEIKDVFSEISKKWGRLDGLVHSIAFADKEDLKRPFHETSYEGFQLALSISAYSLISVAREAYPLLKESQGSLITLTYLGSLRAIPNYNVMGVAKAALESSMRYLAADFGKDGIRVNAISAGPIKTLAASGIKGFRDMLAENAEKTALKRNMSPEDIGNSALYLLSDLGSGVTGDILYVDGGYQMMGL
jgi:enoyl-[acyl-carrier protein] reductase I